MEPSSLSSSWNLPKLHSLYDETRKTTLDLEEGENWISLENDSVAVLRSEQQKRESFLCVDVDGYILTIKDTRGLDSTPVAFLRRFMCLNEDMPLLPRRMRVVQDKDSIILKHRGNEVILRHVHEPAIKTADGPNYQPSQLESQEETNHAGLLWSQQNQPVASLDTHHSKVAAASVPSFPSQNAPATQPELDDDDATVDPDEAMELSDVLERETETVPNPAIVTDNKIQFDYGDEDDERTETEPSHILVQRERAQGSLDGTSNEHWTSIKAGGKDHEHAKQLDSSQAKSSQEPDGVVLAVLAESQQNKLDDFVDIDKNKGHPNSKHLSKATTPESASEKAGASIDMPRDSSNAVERIPSSRINNQAVEKQIDRDTETSPIHNFVEEQRPANPHNFSREGEVTEKIDHTNSAVRPSIKPTCQPLTDINLGDNRTRDDYNLDQEEVRLQPENLNTIRVSKENDSIEIENVIIDTKSSIEKQRSGAENLVAGMPPRTPTVKIERRETRSNKKHSAPDDIQSSLSTRKRARGYTSSLAESEERAIQSSDRKNKRKLITSPPKGNGAGVIRIMATGVDLTLVQKKMVENIGGTFIENIDEAHTATHVIAADADVSIRRTPKLMIAFCKTANIVNLDWLVQSAKAKMALAAEKFLILNDKTAEKKYSFSMITTLERIRTLKGKNRGLFDGWNIFVCKGVAGNKAPPEGELRLVVEATGATYLSSPSQLKSLKPDKTIFITSEPESKQQVSSKVIAKALQQGAEKRSVKWLFDAIMNQSVHM